MSSNRTRVAIALALFGAIIPVGSPGVARSDRSTAPMSYVFTRNANYASSVRVGGELLSPYVVVPEGGDLTLVNLHVWGHAIYSNAWKPGREDLERLFNSQVIPFRGTSLVRGVAELAPGTYGFFCANHMGMRGELLVVSTEQGDR